MKKKLLMSVMLVHSLLNMLHAMAATIEEKMLPESFGMSGWYRDGKTYHYTPENLYRYINGAADQFIAYSFANLVGAVYVSGSATQKSFTIDIYDMQSTLNAFGIFQSKRDPDAAVLQIGAEAFGNDQYLYFYKDRFYVEVQNSAGGKHNEAAIMLMAKNITRAIPGGNAPPAELQYLPDYGRVHGSERYVIGGILGHAFLNRGLTSNYNLDGETVKAFVAFFPAREEAVRSLKKYKIFLLEAGNKALPLNGFGESGFVAQEPFHKNVLAAQQGHFIVGVSDLSRAQAGDALLHSILQKLKDR